MSAKPYTKELDATLDYISAKVDLLSKLRPICDALDRGLKIEFRYNGHNDWYPYDASNWRHGMSHITVMIDGEFRVATQEPKP